MYKQMEGEWEGCVFKTLARTSLEKGRVGLEMQNVAENKKKYSKNETIFQIGQMIICHKLRNKSECLPVVQIFFLRKERKVLALVCSGCHNKVS